MYAWLWRHLPGPIPVRVLIIVVVLAAFTVACFEFVFPAVSPLLPFENMVVGGP